MQCKKKKKKPKIKLPNLHVNPHQSVKKIPSYQEVPLISVRAGCSALNDSQAKYFYHIFPISLKSGSVILQLAAF